MLLIWRGRSFKSITDAILRIRSQARDFNHQDQPLIISTHTIPCVPLQPTELTQPYEAENFADISDTIRPIISVASDTEHHASITTTLQESPFGQSFSINPALGYYDLVITPKTSDIPVSALANIVGYIRAKCPGVISTQITLSETLTVASSSQSFHTRNEHHRLVDIASRITNTYKRLKQAEEQRNFPQRFATNFAQITTSFLSISTAPELDGLIDDLSSFVEELLRQADQLVESRDPTSLREIYNALEDIHLLYKFGFDQRLTGLQVGLANAARNTTSLRPISIQRIVGAASSIPRYVFSKTPYTWKGFLIFGYSPDALRLDAGILNLPIVHLLDPAEWWSLNHEVAHELNAQLNISGISGFQIAIDRYCRLNDSNINEIAQSREFATNLCDEFVAEVFVFVTTCDSDWQFYMQSLWRFLQDYLYGRENLSKILEFILRSLFVLACHLERQKALDIGERLSDAISRGQKLQGNIFAREQDFPDYSAYQTPDLERNLAYRAFAEYSSLADLVNKEIINPIIELCPHLASSVRAIDPENVAQTYESFEIARSDVVRHISEIVPQPTPHRRTHWLSDLRKYQIIFDNPHPLPLNGKESEIWERLASGNIVTDQDVAPHQLIGVLRRVKISGTSVNAEKMTRASLSTILSLWHMNELFRSSSPYLRSSASV